MENVFKVWDSELQGKCKQSWKMAKATYLKRQDDGSIALKYHDTNVFIVYPNNKMILNTDGWLTPTTRARINNMLPSRYYLYQNNSTWYLSDSAENVSYYYKDGLTISPEGKVFARKFDEAIEKRKKAWVRKVNAYAKEMVERAFSRKLRRPTNGDCWYCLMKDKDGKTMGDMSGSNHIEQHIKERYFVPSLFWNAMQEQENYLSMASKGVLGKLWNQQTSDEWFTDIAKDQCTKALKKYLKKRLNIAL